MVVKIIRGVYGFVDDEKNGFVTPKTPNDDPFELDDKKAARLISQGVAEEVKTVKEDKEPDPDPDDPESDKEPADDPDEDKEPEKAPAKKSSSKGKKSKDETDDDEPPFISAADPE